MNYRQHFYWALNPVQGEKSSEDFEDINRFFMGPAGENKQVMTLNNYKLYCAIPTKPTSLEHWSIFASPQWSAFIEGIFYESPFRINNPEEKSKLAQILVEKYRKYGADSLKELNGLFSGILIDHQNDQIISFVDRGGIRRVFAHRNGNSWKLSNNLYALTQFDSTPKELDIQSVFESLAVGFPIGTKTLIKDVIILPPGTATTLKASDIEKKCFLEFFERTEKPINETLETLNGAFDHFFSNIQPKLDNSIGLGLSGGFDSRILFGLIKKLDIQKYFVTCQPEIEVVKKFIPHFNDNTIEVTNDPSTLSDRYRNWIMTEGFAMAWGFIRMGEYLSRKTPFFATGLVGDAISGVFWKLLGAKDYKTALLNWQIKGEHINENLDASLAAQISGVNEEEYMNTMQTSYFGEFDSSGTTVSEYDQIFYHHIHNRCRKRLSIFNTSRSLYAVPLHPYFDNNVFNAYLKLPYSHLKDQYAHRSLIHYINPQLSNFRRAGGAPMKLKNFDRLKLLRRAAYVGRDIRTAYKTYSYTHSFGSELLDETYYTPIKEAGLFDFAALEKILNNSSTKIERRHVSKLLALSLFKQVYLDKTSSLTPEFKTVLDTFNPSIPGE